MCALQYCKYALLELAWLIVLSIFAVLAVAFIASLIDPPRDEPPYEHSAEALQAFARANLRYQK